MVPKMGGGQNVCLKNTKKRKMAFGKRNGDFVCHAQKKREDGSDLTSSLQSTTNGRQRRRHQQQIDKRNGEIETETQMIESNEHSRTQRRPRLGLLCLNGRSYRGRAVFGLILRQDLLHLRERVKKKKREEEKKKKM
jgi:hypothetical protein